jgi:hypothetical protein
MNLINEIENLINSPVDASLFPVKKGNRILIAPYSIIEADSFYTVFYKNQKLGEFYTKLGAVAFAREARKNYSYAQEIERLDRILEKNLNDCVFYRNKIEKDKNQDSKRCATIRFEDSRAHIKEVRDKLRSFIFPQS